MLLRSSDCAESQFQSVTFSKIVWMHTNVPLYVCAIRNTLSLSIVDWTQKKILAKLMTAATNKKEGTPTFWNQKLLYGITGKTSLCLMRLD